MNDNNNKKKKKRLEQIVIEIEEKQENFDKLVEESKRILELNQREYNSTVNSAETKLFKSRKEIILEAGKYLENNLELLTNSSPNYICRVLKQKFKGIIRPNTISAYCPEKWKSIPQANAGRLGANIINSRRGGLAEVIPAKSEEQEQQPLTEYEQEFVKIHEKKIKHNDL